MNERDFFDRLTLLLQNIKERYELEILHDALIVWFAENYLLLDPDDVKDRIVQDAKAECQDNLNVREMRSAYIEGLRFGLELRSYLSSDALTCFSLR